MLYIIILLTIIIITIRILKNAKVNGAYVAYIVFYEVYTKKGAL